VALVNGAGRNAAAIPPAVTSITPLIRSMTFRLFSTVTTTSAIRLAFASGEKPAAIPPAACNAEMAGGATPASPRVNAATAAEVSEIGLRRFEPMASPSSVKAFLSLATSAVVVPDLSTSAAPSAALVVSSSLAIATRSGILPASVAACWKAPAVRTPTKPRPLSHCCARVGSIALISLNLAASSVNPGRSWPVFIIWLHRSTVTPAAPANVSGFAAIERKIWLNELAPCCAVRPASARTDAKAAVSVNPSPRLAVVPDSALVIWAMLPALAVLTLAMRTRADPIDSM
jgi:hypothetical protein